MELIRWHCLQQIGTLQTQIQHLFADSRKTRKVSSLPRMKFGTSS